MNEEDIHDKDTITETDAEKCGIPVELIYDVIYAKTDLNLYKVVEETYERGEMIYLLHDRCIASREKLLSLIEERWKENFKSIEDFLRFPWERYRSPRVGKSRVVHKYGVLHDRSIYQVPTNGAMPVWSIRFIPASNLSSCEGLRVLDEDEG